MSLGLGIFLLVIGGIFAFGIRDQWSAIDLTAIGWVCIAAGILTIVLSLVLMQMRRKRTNTTYVERRDNPPPPPPPTV